MKILVAAASLALAACASAAAQSAAPQAPDWMSGYWLACEGGETSENWIGAGSGMLVGSAVSRGQRVGFEFLRMISPAHHLCA